MNSVNSDTPTYKALISHVKRQTAQDPSNRASELKFWKKETKRGSCSYGTLQNHGHPLFLLHHVEVLAKVWGHVPLSQVFWIVLIHPVEVPLLVRRCGRGW